RNAAAVVEGIGPHKTGRDCLVLYYAPAGSAPYYRVFGKFGEQGAFLGLNLQPDLDQPASHIQQFAAAFSEFAFEYDHPSAAGARRVTFRFDLAAPKGARPRRYEHAYSAALRNVDTQSAAGERQ